MEERYPLSRRLLAWGVHLYTALGLPLAFICVHAMAVGNARAFFLAQTAACVIDASDGFFARRWEVKKVVPGFNGRRLDDIVDYLHFVALPLMAIPAFDLLPNAAAPIIILPLMASAYGFCQEMAKTEDSFVGFPSYWNVVVLYLYVWQLPTKGVVVMLSVLSLLIFVPIHYVYPSKTRRWQATTLVLGILWTAMIVAISLRPDGERVMRLANLSLFFPAWYLFVSAVHHRDVLRRTAEGMEPEPG